MNILIAGATGFIGSHLGRILAAHHNVFGITRSATVLPEFFGRPVVADLSDCQFAESLPENIDCVMHLAQSLRYRDFPGGVYDMRRVNIDATVDLLEWARKAGVKHFIFTSTANVYGESIVAHSESHLPQPSSFYGASKLAAEHLVMQYQKYFQVDVLRCFTVYGPSQRGMLIPNIMERIATGKPITLAEGDGIYLSPIYVGDVVNIIHRLITTPSPQSRLMNVCGDEVSSLSEIVKILEKISGKPATIQLTNEKAARFTGSNTLLKEYLGSYQFVDIQTGLERVFHSNNVMY